MLKLLLPAFVASAALISQPAHAIVKNPWMRTCMEAGGQFYNFRSNGDDSAMCYFGSAAIGAEALFLFKSNAGETEAIQSYRQGASSCEAAGATSLSGSGKNGNGVLCKFSDNSLVDEATLSSGAGAPQNSGLDEALASSN
jgi:hypothetical protein